MSAGQEKNGHELEIWNALAKSNLADLDLLLNHIVARLPFGLEITECLSEFPLKKNKLKSALKSLQWLGFVSEIKDAVVGTEAGREYLASPQPGRLAVLRAKLLGLDAVSRWLVELQRSPGQTMTTAQARQFFANHFAHSVSEASIKDFVLLATAAELLKFDAGKKSAVYVEASTPVTG